MATMTKSHTRKPKVFTGDRKKLDGFIRDCRIYITSNDADFPDDNSKSQFILSYVGGGEAESWKEWYIDNKIERAPGTFTWPTPNDLFKNLRDNFAKEDNVEELLRKLETMKQGNKTAEEIVNEFQVLIAQAKLTDSPLIVRMFRRTLNPSLAIKVLTDPSKPDKLEDTPATATTAIKYGWYSKAIQYDQIYQDARNAQQEDYGGNPKNRNFRQAVQKGNERNWRNTAPQKPYRDPNAMDVDAMELNVNTMSKAKKAYLMKKGACFKCEVAGHMARDHNEYVKSLKKPSSGFSKASSGFSQKKPDAKEIAKFIRAMNREEQDALFEEVGKNDSLSDKAQDF